MFASKARIAIDWVPRVNPPPQRSRKVIVVGAGLAGLSAAWELSRAGYDVDILEARTRAGGRVHTLHEGFADHMYAESGAMSFPDTHRLVIHYAQQFDLPLQNYDMQLLAPVFQLGGQRIVVRFGAEIHWPVEMTDEERSLGLIGLQQKYLGPGIKQVGDPRQPGWPPESLRPLDQMTGAEYLVKQGASPGAVTVMEMSLLELDGEGITSYSALWMLASQAVIQNFNQVFTVRGGNDLLPSAFADRMRERIQYGSPVVRIESGDQGAAVFFLHRGERQMLEADRVICALPYSVLRDVEISPALSPGKQMVIQNQQNTSVTRVFVQSGRRFWEDQGLSGQAFTDQPIMSLESLYQRPSVRGILTSYTTGETARQLQAMGEQQRLDWVVPQMENVFPGIAALAEGGTSKCWDEDIWSKGAYAWYKPGEVFSFWPHLATPEGRLHFAGDHTSVLAGWMEGALESAARVVREIQQADS